MDGLLIIAYADLPAEVVVTAGEVVVTAGEVVVPGVRIEVGVVMSSTQYCTSISEALTGH
jgi:hypothetical protein